MTFTSTVLAYNHQVPSKPILLQFQPYQMEVQ